MRYYFAIILCLPFILTNAQENPLWMRHIAISPDATTIAFTYKGDLYTIPVGGGIATQITFHEAHDYMATWSKDGSKIAFASNRYGNFDIYTMDANGGEATRLTFHSNDELPYSFTHDDQEIIFGAIRQDISEHRQAPNRSQTELYSVPASGGRVDQIFTFPAEYVQVTSDGNKLLYHDRKGYENEWRKHHESSIARDLWVYNKADDSHTMITSYEGEDRQPVLSEDEKTVFFLSEKSGTFNVHQLSLENPSNRSQVTNFELHPVRFLSYAKGVLCFGYDGEIYTMKEGEQPQKVNVEIRTQSVSNKDQFISINGGVSEMAISPSGKEIAFISRGEVFVTSVGESFTKRLTNTPQNESFVEWGPEGKYVSYSSERNGKWSIYKSEKVREEEPFFYAATLVKETPILENNSDNYLGKFSPDGKKMAFVKDRRNIVVKDLTTNSDTVILSREELYHFSDGDKYFEWSPDSKWLLIDWGKTLSNSEILLASANGDKKVNLTKSGYQDSRPKWVNEGKQMIWFSNRDGLKSYATSGRSEEDVYTMFFDQEAWDKFNLSDEEYKLMKAIKEEKEKKEKEAADKKKKEEEAQAEKEDKKSKKNNDKDKDEDSVKEEEKKDSTLNFAWDKMEEWNKRLTIHSSRLGDAVLSKDGEKLYYLSQFEDKMNLWTTNLRTKETKMAMKLGTSFGRLIWDDKRENLYLLSSGKISKIDPESNKNEPVEIDGEMEFDVNAERQAIFDHVWIRTNAIFYEPSFHGINWDLMKTEYEKFVPHIGNPHEMAEMLSEMLGELNVSHAGGRYGGIKVNNPDQTASLGIFLDYDYDQDGILITEILAGGPLDKSDMNVTPGMVIKSINGNTISLDQDIAKYLNRIAGDFTLLEVYDPANDSTHMVTMKPITLGEESGLLYKRWVKQNEEEVKEKSNGQLGYVHIPGMADGPYRSIYQDMLGKYADAKGIIVDTRFNGGGDLVADLAMFFTGEHFITYATADKVVGGEPTSRWTKPTLAMINEAQYSDGHCFACGYTDLEIGKTVGMPTPGTCSFAGWERLPDGNVWGVVPVSAKDINGNWMENNQTNPDIQIKNMPGVIDKGRDQQLEKAIEVMMTDLGIE